MGTVTTVRRLVVHRIAAVREHVVAVRAGRADSDAAGIRPDVRGQVGVVVIDSRVDLRDHDRAASGRHIPGRNAPLVGARGSGVAVHGLAGVEITPLQPERRIVRSGILLVHVVGLSESHVPAALQRLNRRQLIPAGNRHEPRPADERPDDMPTHSRDVGRPDALGRVSFEGEQHGALAIGRSSGRRPLRRRSDRARRQRRGAPRLGGHEHHRRAGEHREPRERRPAQHLTHLESVNARVGRARAARPIVVIVSLIGSQLDAEKVELGERDRTSS